MTNLWHFKKEGGASAQRPAALHTRLLGGLPGAEWPEYRPQSPKMQLPSTGTATGAGCFVETCNMRGPEASGSYSRDAWEVSGVMHQTLTVSETETTSARFHKAASAQKRSMPHAHFARKGFPSARMVVCDLRENLSGRKPYPPKCTIKFAVGSG